MNKIEVGTPVGIKSNLENTISAKAMKEDQYTIVSLFSGCGGLDLGFAQLGADSLKLREVDKHTRDPRGTFFRIVWANDILLSSCETYSANFNVKMYTDPNEPYSGKARVFHGDIAKVDFTKAVGQEKVDLVLGGFPCQDFSIIRGKEDRKGIRVKRGRLYCHFVRALAHIQPKMFVAENVKGLVSSNRGLAYQQILDDFQNLNIRWEEVEMEYSNFHYIKASLELGTLEGYQILFSDVINFAKLGVPQARERLIIVGLRKDLARKLDSIDGVKRKLDDSLRGRGTAYSESPLTPIEVFYGKTLNNLSEEYRNIMMEYACEIRKVNSLRAKEYLGKVWPNYSMEIWHDYLWINSNGRVSVSLKEWVGRQSEEEAREKLLRYLGYCGRSLTESEAFVDNSNKILKEMSWVEERMKRIPPGENHEFVKDTEYHVVGLMSNIYRRIHPLKPSPTIIAKGGGGTWGYHFAQNRQRLTNRERARLQTFPDNFIFKGKPWEVRNQLGEAVPPLASKIIAECTAETLAWLLKLNLLVDV